jgi:subtilase family serine protease
VIDRAYELEGLRAQGLHGEGQTVAIVSLDTFDADDVAKFDRMAGTSGPRVQRVKVNGGFDRPGDDQDEVNLDIDVIRAVAPKAQIINYESPNRSGALANVVDRIVADGKAEIISISWGRASPCARPTGCRGWPVPWPRPPRQGSPSSSRAATTAPMAASTRTARTC